eukprot:gene30123-35103_t
MVGLVTRFEQSEEVCLEMNGAEVPEDCTVGHRVEPVTLRVHAPKAGYNSMPGLPELNHSQLHAVKSVMQSPLSLIQGPPGTGKTVTSAAIVYHMAQTGTGQVLVAAPSNVAVDHLADKCSQTGLKVVRMCAKSREDVVRMCAKSREDVVSSVQHLTLHYQVQHLNLPNSEYYQKLLLLKSEKGGLNAEDEKRFKELRRKLEMEILEHADVVCCTCVGAGDARLQNFRFQHVLIDESTQSTEPEALIPMMLGAKQVVLVGDHCQLGPVIMCKRAAEAGLCQSLFERLRLLGVKPIRLQVQYRMHPCLSEFPSNTFYEGTLQNGTGVGDRIMKGVDYPWPNPDKPMMFYVQLGQEEISASATSYLNRTEATNVEKICASATSYLNSTEANNVEKDLYKGIEVSSVDAFQGREKDIIVLSCVRSNEQGSIGFLGDHCCQNGIEVSSVDAFQGREKDIIVLSCVRSNEQGSIGFLGDPRRLNVALTRARYGLVLLGNPRVLSRQPLWNSLLNHFKENGTLVEGPLANLKQSMVQLTKPRKVFDRGSFGIGTLTTNRYQPTERVGEPLPNKPHPGEGYHREGGGSAGGSAAYAAVPPTSGPPQTGGGGRPGGGYNGVSGNKAAGSGRQAGATSGVGQSQGQSQGTFMPFAMPTYAIPSPDTRSGGRKAASGFSAPGGPTSQSQGLGFTGAVGNSQLDGAPFTQAPRTQQTQGESQVGAGFGPLGGFGHTGGPGAFTQAPGGEYSQQAYVDGGLGLGGGLNTQGMDDFGTSQYDTLLSQGFGDATGGLGLGAGVADMNSQGGYGGFIDPSTGEVFQ